MRSAPKRPIARDTKDQDPEAHRRLSDIAARRDAEEGIRQGLEDAKKGRIRCASKFFAEFEASHGFSR